MGRIRTLVVVVALALLVAACGARLTDEEVREADELSLSVPTAVR